MADSKIKMIINKGHDFNSMNLNLGIEILINEKSLLFDFPD